MQFSQAPWYALPVHLCRFRVRSHGGLFPGTPKQPPQSDKKKLPSGSVTISWPRNINLVPIDYAFRPRLRGRLTLLRLACAAGRARPGIALALQHSVKPESVVTVFAGADIEATECARKHFSGYAPSSPSVALLRNGKVVYMLERHQIENQEAPEIAQQLMAAFDKHCAGVPVV